MLCGIDFINVTGAPRRNIETKNAPCIAGGQPVREDEHDRLSVHQTFCSIQKSGKQRKKSTGYRGTHCAIIRNLLGSMSTTASPRLLENSNKKCKMSW